MTGQRLVVRSVQRVGGGEVTDSEGLGGDAPEEAEAEVCVAMKAEV